MVSTAQDFRNLDTQVVTRRRKRLEFFRYDVDSDASERYGIIQDVFTADGQLNKNDVALGTILNYRGFQNVLRLAKQWGGTMEVSVYISSVLLWEPTMDLLQVIRDNTPILKQSVSWHIICPLWEDFDAGLQYLSIPNALNPDNVTRKLEQLVKKAIEIELNSNDTLPFPATLMINTAYDASGADFFFYIDSNLTPSMNLRKKFLEFSSRKKIFSRNRPLRDGESVGPGVRISKCGQYRSKTFSVIPRAPWKDICASYDDRPTADVYVVPTFQTSSNYIPRTIQDVKQEYRLGLTSAYYYKVFPPAYEPTNHKLWIENSRDGAVDCAYQVKYTLYYEPFIIVPKGVPKHDERFEGFAFIRSNHHATLAAAGYKFKVLKNVFLIHEGWKDKNHLTARNKEEIQEAFPKWWKFVKETEKRFGLID